MCSIDANSFNLKKKKFVRGQALKFLQSEQINSVFFIPNMLLFFACLVFKIKNIISTFVTNKNSTKFLKKKVELLQFSKIILIFFGHVIPFV